MLNVFVVVSCDLLTQLFKQYCIDFITSIVCNYIKNNILKFITNSRSVVYYIHALIRYG